MAGLQFPPHTVALASIYLAGLLATFEVVVPAPSDEMAKAKAIVDLLSAQGDWEDRYLVKLDDLEGSQKAPAAISAYWFSQRFATRSLTCSLHKQALFHKAIAPLPQRHLPLLLIPPHGPQIHSKVALQVPFSPTLKSPTCSLPPILRDSRLL